MTTKTMTRRKFLKGLGPLALAALASLACGDWAERRNKWFKRTGKDRPEPDNGKRGNDEADYYRGVYTVCMVLNAKMAENGATNLIDCDELVRAAIERGWYEREAPGFEWPPEQDVSLTDA